MLDASDFGEFFASCNSGRSPFRWQQRLVNHILTENRWPDRIVAPTGSGKSAVIEVHVFVTAVAALSRGACPPRRLVAAVNRRALVDNQVDRARAVRQTLESALAGTVAARVAEALRGLRTAENLDPVPPFDIVVLRGGAPRSSEWLDDPAACTVICATPDMWGSRVLFRGYGSSRGARPREAGLLAMDVALVVDEAHLSRQLIRTAARIALLQSGSETVGVPTLQVVATTATQAVDTQGSDIGVEFGDFATDEPLSRRLTTPKPVRLVESEFWPADRGAGRKRLVELIADRAENLHRDHARTVGVLVNTVSLAVEVGETLAKSRGRKVQVVVGRMRPADLSALRAEHPGLFTVEGDQGVEFLVATQTIEVGVDIDLAAMVTEPAPGAALAQRAGRVNRLGLSDDAEIEVITPLAAVDVAAIPRVGPYRGAAVADGLAWLARHAATSDGLAPWSLTDDPPPVNHAERRWQDLEWADLTTLVDTSGIEVVTPDLELWLDDDLDDSAEVAVVVRDRLPLDPASAMALVAASLPTEVEHFPTTIGTARTVMASHLASKSGGCFRVRQGEVEQLLSENDIRPGDVLVVDDSARLFRCGVVDPDGTDTADSVFNEPSGDDFARVAYFAPRRRVRDRLDGDADRRGDLDERVLADLDELVAGERRDTVRRRANLADAVNDLLDGIADDLHDRADNAAERSKYQWAARMLRLRKKDAELVIGPDDVDGRISWIVLRDTGSRLGSELQQVYSRSAQVLLSDHSASVAGRARCIAERLGLPQPLAEILELAGLHHDDGKIEKRFQRVLHNCQDPDPSVVLAKSGGVTASAAGVSAVRLDPAGWRHEQLSVVIAAEALGARPGLELILRLVGTSHGHGRGLFKDGHEVLLGSETTDDVVAIAERLFGQGEWEDLLDDCHRQWGPWGCAFLEAVLRAADCRISEEGR